MLVIVTVEAVIKIFVSNSPKLPKRITPMPSNALNATEAGARVYREMGFTTVHEPMMRLDL